MPTVAEMAMPLGEGCTSLIGIIVLIIIISHYVSRSSPSIVSANFVSIITKVSNCCLPFRDWKMQFSIGCRRDLLLLLLLIFDIVIPTLTRIVWSLNRILDLDLQEYIILLAVNIRARIDTKTLAWQVPLRVQLCIQKQLNRRNLISPALGGAQCYNRLINAQWYENCYF